ncbi:NAD(P)-binding protein [Streptomyces chiangmaiensis]
MVVIGTGAGGGTLAHRPAPTGKRVLILERGDRLPACATTGTPRPSSSGASTGPLSTGTTRTATRSRPR